MIEAKVSLLTKLSTVCRIKILFCAIFLNYGSKLFNSNGWNRKSFCPMFANCVNVFTDPGSLFWTCKFFSSNYYSMIAVKCDWFSKKSQNWGFLWKKRCIFSKKPWNFSKSRKVVNMLYKAYEWILYFRMFFFTLFWRFFFQTKSPKIFLSRFGNYFENKRSFQNQYFPSSKGSSRL